MEEAPLLAAVNLHKTYRKHAIQVPVLGGVDLEVSAGEFLSVVGASGSGKSTLLKHLIGLYQPIQGDVLISGASLVRAEGDERLRILRKFGVLYQGGALFGSLTTVENVRLPLDEFTDLSDVAKDLIALSKLRLVGLESLYLGGG